MNIITDHYLTNQINKSMSSLCDKYSTYFEVQYDELDPKEGCNPIDYPGRIRLKLRYIPLDVFVIIADFIWHDDKERAKRSVIDSFNEHYMIQVLFSKPTNGDIVDSFGKRIYTFAECIEHFKQLIN